MAPQPLQFHVGNVVVWEEWREVCEKRLQYATTLKIPHLPILEPREGKCAIVGAAPSVTKYVDQIRAIKEGPSNIVMSLNAAHNWLINRDIIPNIHVKFEIDSLALSLGGPPHSGVTYYLASILEQDNFEELEGYDRVLWHVFLPPVEYTKFIGKYFPGEYMVCGGYVTFFRSLAIAQFLGYRDFELFGLDSSFEGSDHVEGYALANIEPSIKIYGKHGETGELKEFITNPSLAHQAKEFLEFCEAQHTNFKLKVHGNGLLRFLHESRYSDQYV